MRALPVLTADCSACTALCCMALPFDAGEAFAEDKPALHPCKHLSGHACRLHARLVEAGYRGCAGYDCQGAGQRLMAEVFPGADWRCEPDLRAPMALAFGRLRRIHALLDLLVSAGALPLDAGQARTRAALIARCHPEAGWSAETLAGFDLAGAEAEVARFLAGLRPLAGALRRGRSSSTSAGKTEGDAPWP